MDKKIFFTDLDGTLLNDDKEITPGNQAAIDETLAQGHIVVISTGRPLPSARIQAQRLGLTRKGCYAITYNGSQIYDMYREETIYARPVPLELVGPLFHSARERGLHIQTYSSTHVVAERETQDLKAYSQRTLLPYQVVPDITAALAEAPYKILAVDFAGHERLVRFQQEVMTEYEGVLDNYFSDDNLLEIIPAGISKGFAVKWMCDYLGIPLENSVAAGDAQNDITMLEAAHIGAVMRNAFPGIAEHGDYVTQADNNHDGVAEILHRFILSK